MATKQRVELKSVLAFASGAIVLAALALCLALTARTAAQNAPKISPENRTKLESAVSRFMSANSVPGVSVAVVEGGEEVWSEGFGMADLENFVPASSRTLYRLGSVSKPLTAIAAMQLWERGKLDLDAPVQKYCPAFPEKQWPVTTREVLGHLGGIRHYHHDATQDDPEIGNVKHFDDPIAAGLKFFAADPLLAQPGTKFNYSTHGYTLAGCVIEGASGEKYVNYMRENVFGPAEMAATQADDHYTVIANRTRFYSKDKSGRVINADFLDSSYKIPGGGLISSADDMARFEAAILNDRLIHRATRDAMWTPQKAIDSPQNSYGLGWGNGKIKGIATVGHSGSQQGTSTAIIIAPEQRDGVVVLVNMDDVNAFALGSELLEMIVSPEESDGKK
jgi:serine beta-lactamase-like protein LACTB, mitochondrial